MNFDTIAVNALNGLAKRTGKKLAKKEGYPEKPAPATPVRMKNTQDDLFRCGFASKVAMPENIHDHTYYLAGHRTGKTVADILDPLTVSAMWLDCKDGGMLLIGADVVGFANVEVNAIRDSLKDFAEQTDCRSINILCTHNHAGIDTLGYWGKGIAGSPIPSDGKDPQYMALLTQNIRECCEQAYAERKEGKLYIGTIHVPDAVYRKREPIYCRDVLSRIRFVPEDGSKETWWLNFGAHPNTMGGANQRISAEYPGFMRAKINEIKPTNVLFGVGAIAACDPGQYSENVYECARMEGVALAEAAFAIDNDVQLAPEITVVRQPYFAPVDNAVLALMSIVKTVNYKKVACKDSDLGLALVTEMTFIQIGSQKILLLPGEALPEFVFDHYSPAETSATGMGPEVNAKPLVRVADDDNLIVFGLSNDMTGYMVPVNDFILNETGPYLNTAKDRFGNRHYHETNSLSPKITQVVSDTFATIMQQVQ